MICTQCEEKNVSDAKYCASCGVILTSNTNSNVEGSVDRYFSEKKNTFIEEAKRLADSEMKQGIIWFVIALAITFGGYIFAREGGTYYVFWGAMIYGGYRLIRGIGYKLNPESLLEKVEEESKKEK